MEAGEFIHKTCLHTVWLSADLWSVQQRINELRVGTECVSDDVFVWTYQAGEGVVHAVLQSVFL